MIQNKYIEMHDKTPYINRKDIMFFQGAVDLMIDRLRMKPEYKILYHSGLDIDIGTHPYIYIPFDHTKPKYILSFRLVFFKDVKTINMVLSEYDIDKLGESFSNMLLHNYLNEVRNLL